MNFFPQGGPTGWGDFWKFRNFEICRAGSPDVSGTGTGWGPGEGRGNPHEIGVLRGYGARPPERSVGIRRGGIPGGAFPTAAQGAGGVRTGDRLHRSLRTVRKDMGAGFDGTGLGWDESWGF